MLLECRGLVGQIVGNLRFVELENSWQCPPNGAVRKEDLNGAL